MENIENEIRQFILTELKTRAKRCGLSAEELNDNDNFIESGLVDSFGLLELLTALEKGFDITINFGDLDPSEFTTLKGMVFHCAAAIKKNK